MFGPGKIKPITIGHITVLDRSTKPGPGAQEKDSVQLIINESFKGGDIDDLRAGGEGAGDGMAEELVDADEEGGEGFSGAGGGGDEGWLASEDAGPAVLLGLGGRAEFVEEPLGGDGVSPSERGWNFYRGWRCEWLGRHG